MTNKERRDDAPRRSTRDGPARGRCRCNRLERLPGNTLERRAGEGRGTTNAIRIDAARAQGLSQAQTQIDVATFTQWVDAYAHKETLLTDFYFKRFRKEFRPAVDAWLATRPLKNPNAPLTPFAMPQYKLAATAEAKRLDAEAEVSAATVRRDIQRSSNYVLGVVLFSVALFFAGMSTKLSDTALQTLTLAVGYVVFLGTLVWIAHIPGELRGLVGIKDDAYPCGFMICSFGPVCNGK